MLKAKYYEGVLISIVSVIATDFQEYAAID
jgi:hypothetical protein